MALLIILILLTILTVFLNNNLLSEHFLDKFTMASLIDGTFVEPDGTSNDNESVEDGDSQGDIDMDDRASGFYSVI